MRKEVTLTEDVVTLLQSKADKKKWSLKKYMEEVLIKDATKNNIKHNSANSCESHAGRQDLLSHTTREAASRRIKKVREARKV